MRPLKWPLIYLSTYSHKVLSGQICTSGWDMANTSLRGSKNGRRGEANPKAEFSCSLHELRLLMELRGAEALTRIQECYGDVNGLCARLKTSAVMGKYVQKLWFCVQFVSAQTFFLKQQGWGRCIPKFNQNLWWIYLTSCVRHAQNPQMGKANFKVRKIPNCWWCS